MKDTLGVCPWGLYLVLDASPSPCACVWEGGVGRKRERREEKRMEVCQEDMKTEVIKNIRL